MDQGVHFGYWRKNFPLALSVGDFDSVTVEERQLIHALPSTLFRKPSQKNDTDLELALLTILKNPRAQVTIFGALGSHIDHMLANVFSTQQSLIGTI